MKTRLFLKQNESVKARWAVSRGSALGKVVRSKKSGGGSARGLSIMKSSWSARKHCLKLTEAAMEIKGLKGHRAPPPSSWKKHYLKWCCLIPSVAFHPLSYRPASSCYPHEHKDLQTWVCVCGRGLAWEECKPLWQLRWCTRQGKNISNNTQNSGYTLSSRTY